LPTAAAIAALEVNPNKLRRERFEFDLDMVYPPLSIIAGNPRSKHF
jgi:hypothetical protein